MESTTLDQAVESLLAPSEETSGEDNLSDAVEEMIEPTDDGQSEDIEASEESSDDVETSNDDLDDVEIDDEDLKRESKFSNMQPHCNSSSNKSCSCTSKHKMAVYKPQFLRHVSFLKVTQLGTWKKN